MIRKVNSGMKWSYVYMLLGVVVTGFTSLIYFYNISLSDLATLDFYENLANPSIKIVRVQEGLRKEEIADFIGDKLGWDETEKTLFVNAHLALGTRNLEGHYFPKTYLIPKDENPAEVSNTMFSEFSKETSKIKKAKTTQVVNQDTAIKIASIIQREAAGKGDMKLISGIIWNRIFDGMKLQIDATLQYAKGNEEDGWWGQVDPIDKKIVSPYNTYTNKGLPPSAIANPGIAAIEAAYNPQKTSCIFYLHDRNRNIHCAVTYEQHKRNIEKYY